MQNFNFYQRYDFSLPHTVQAGSPSNPVGIAGHDITWIKCPEHADKLHLVPRLIMVYLTTSG
jgi:hypothetical protein